MILSLHFNSHFSRWTWISPYQNVPIMGFIGAKDEWVAASGAIIRAKFQSYLTHHQYNNTQLFTGWMPFLSPKQH